MLETLLALYNPNMNPACLIPIKIVGVSDTPELSFFLLTFSLPFSLVVSWLHVPAASISGCHFLPSCIFFNLLQSLTLQKTLYCQTTSSKSCHDTCSHWQFQQHLPFMWCPVSLKHHKRPKHHYVHFIFLFNSGALPESHCALGWAAKQQWQDEPGECQPWKSMICRMDTAGHFLKIHIWLEGRVWNVPGELATHFSLWFSD